MRLNLIIKIGKIKSFDLSNWNLIIVINGLLCTQNEIQKHKLNNNGSNIGTIGGS